MFCSNESAATGTRWVDLKDMVLGQRTQTQKNTYNIISFIQSSKPRYIK